MVVIMMMVHHFFVVQKGLAAKETERCKILCCLLLMRQNKKTTFLQLLPCALNVLQRDVFSLKRSILSCTYSKWVNIGDCTQINCTRETHS